MKYLSLFISLLLAILQGTFAQEECGTMQMMNLAVQNNPELGKVGQKVNERAKKQKKISNKNAGNYVIPVVFHIFHEYGEENVTKEKIDTAVQALNAYFQKTHDDVDQIIPEFVARAANTQIEFRLAKIDPNGNCTEGITRTESDLTNYGGENVKALQTWNTTKYLNIWSVKNTANGSAGYSYLPGRAPSQSAEGVVIESEYVSNHKVLVHEVGHFLNLDHTWGPLNPGDPYNCSIDDDVNDTPNTIGPDGCNFEANNCGSLDNVQNYMTYGNCRLMFTEGQKMRMHAALESSFGSRNTLWQETNLIATGTSDGYISQTCKPIADFNVSNTVFCSDEAIDFINNSYNANPDSMTWTWTFPGGTPSSSDVENPTISYKEKGVYNITLTATNGAGSDVITKMDQIIVRNTENGEEVPFFEGMENTTFPDHPTENDKNWEVDGGLSSWARTTDASASGDASIRIFNFPANSTPNTLISPTIDLSGSENTKLNFKVAFAQRSVDDEDELRVFSSTDCGKNWSLEYIKSRKFLATNDGEPVTGLFIPTSSEWREESIPLSTLDGESAVLIKFQITSGGGNYLYLDDIHVTGNNNATGLDAKRESLIDLNIFPNPITESSAIDLEMKAPAVVSIAVMDILGNVIMSNDLGKINGLRQYNFLKNGIEVPSGIYLLKVTVGNEKIVRKIII